MAIAIITRGKTSGRRATIVQWPATIGRDPASVLQIDDDRVSRNHARIKKRDKLYIIEDLQSRNGTYLNGENITNCVISSGDRVLVGDTEFVFLTPETQVDLATEMAELEHFALAEDLVEVGGPIAVAGSFEGSNAISSKRLASEMELQGAGLTAEILRKIFELQANILSSDDVKECSANILKALHTLNGKISRSVLFIWSPNSGKKKIPKAKSWKHLARNLQPGDVIVSKNIHNPTNFNDNLLHTFGGSKHVHTQLYTGKGKILQTAGEGFRVAKDSAKTQLSRGEDVIVLRPKMRKSEIRKGVDRAHELLGAKYETRKQVVGRGLKMLAGVPGKACHLGKGDNVVCTDVISKAYPKAMPNRYAPVESLQTSKHFKPVMHLNRMKGGKGGAYYKGVRPMLSALKVGIPTYV